MQNGSYTQLSLERERAFSTRQTNFLNKTMYLDSIWKLILYHLFQSESSKRNISFNETETKIQGSYFILSPPVVDIR